MHFPAANCVCRIAALGFPMNSIARNDSYRGWQVRNIQSTTHCTVPTPLMAMEPMRAASASIVRPTQISIL
jgi:hypothetical protein